MLFWGLFPARAATINVCEYDGGGCDYYFYNGDDSIKSYEELRGENTPDNHADVNAIQAAIIEAEAGDTISVGEGTYVLEAYIMFEGKNDISFSGAGASLTIFDRSGISAATTPEPYDVPDDVFSINSIQGGTISDLTLTGVDNSGGEYSKFFVVGPGGGEGAGDVVTISNLILDCDVPGDDDTVMGFSIGVDATEVIISNLVFDGCQTSVDVTYSEETEDPGVTIEVTNSIFNNVDSALSNHDPDATMTGDYNNYWGCDPDECNTGVTAGANDLAVDPAFVSTTEGSEDFSLRAYSACIGAGESGVDIGAVDYAGTRRDDIYVHTLATALTYDANGESSWDYATIEDAVSATKTGDTIHVYAGTYVPSSTISITRDITLQAVSGDSVTISGASLSASDVIQVSGVDGVTLSDFTLSSAIGGYHTTSMSPLAYGGTDYDFGDDALTLWFYDNDPENVGIIEADASAIAGLDGSTDINVGLCELAGGEGVFGTIYHASDLASSAATLESWFNTYMSEGLEMVADCAGRYYKTGVFTGNGSYADYTYAGELDGDGALTDATLVTEYGSTTPNLTFVGKMGISIANAGISGTPTALSGLTLDDSVAANLTALGISGTSVATVTNSTIEDSVLYNVIHSGSAASQMVNTDFEYDSDPALTSVTGTGTLEAYYRTRGVAESSTVGSVLWTDSSGAAAVGTDGEDIEDAATITSGVTSWVTPLAYSIDLDGATSLNDFSLTYTDALGDSSVTANTLDTVDEEVTLVIGGVYGLLPPPSGISDYFSPPAPPDGGDDGDEGGDRDEGDGDEGDGDSGDGEAGGLPTGFAEADKFLLPVELEKGKARLLKVPGHAAVYIVNPASGQRQVFLHGRNFEAFGLAWDDVEEVEPEELAEFTLSKPALYPVGSLVKFPTDPKVYLVTGSYTLRWIEADEFEEAGYSFGDIRDVPVAFFALFDFE